MTSVAGPAKRPYDSTRRRALAADNRAAVIRAASRLFAERGWSGTSVRDIAREAGVSVETVYGTSGSKGQLLLHTIDVGVVGDDEPVPLADRPAFVALGDGERAARLCTAVDLLATQYARIARLLRALAQAAAGDAEMAVHLHESRARQRQSFQDGLRLVLGGEPPPELVDGLRAIASPEVYLRLVEEAGWSPEQYRAWLADVVLKLLAAPPEETA